MDEFFGSFHFLRPIWFLALLPLAAIAYRMLRDGDPRRGLEAQIAPHLLEHLMIMPGDRPGFRPVHALLGLWAVSVFALAGPAWQRIPNPLFEDESGLVVVLKMTPSMSSGDLPPSRLERSRIKIDEILARRDSGRTALVAYAGSAHQVMPLTRDAAIIGHMIEALEPGIMPREGDALGEALELARGIVGDSGRPGSILLVADGVTAAALSSTATGSIPIQVLGAVGSREELDNSGLNAVAERLDARLQRITPDESDVDGIVLRASAAAVTGPGELAQRWQDGGYFLLPIILLIALLWSRRGWSVQVD